MTCLQIKKKLIVSTEHKQIESAGDNLGCAITQVLDFFSSNKGEAFPQYLRKLVRDFNRQTRTGSKRTSWATHEQRGIQVILF